MSVLQLEEGLKLIEGKAGGFFKGEISDALIEKAELFLGVKFPKSYRAFLKKKGCGNFLSKEFYGISSDEFESGSVPNGIWLTNNERKSSDLDHSLILVGQSMEGYYALATSQMKDGECPVVDSIPGINPKELEVIAPDFGTFFLNQIREVI